MDSVATAHCRRDRCPGKPDYLAAGAEHDSSAGVSPASVVRYHLERYELFGDLGNPSRATRGSDRSLGLAPGTAPWSVHLTIAEADGRSAERSLRSLFI